MSGALWDDIDRWNALASGIGRAAARVLLADGHRVLVHARSRERGEPVAKALGGDVALAVGDLARINDVRRLADQAREHGPIDPWVHNAGAWGGQHAADLGARSRDDLCGERRGAAPTDPPAVRRAAGTPFRAQDVRNPLVERPFNWFKSPLGHVYTGAVDGSRPRPDPEALSFDDQLKAQYQYLRPPTPRPI